MHRTAAAAVLVDAELTESQLNDLIQQAAALDREAFGQLYRRYVTRIHRYIAYQINDRVLAEDLTNQVFLRAMQAIGRYEHRSVSEFNAWLYRIAKNVVVDNWRSRRDTVPLDEALVAERGETLDAHFESLARRDELRQAMARLTDDQRQVLTYRFGLGLTHGEAARLLGRNEPAVRALQFRAVSALRKIMARDDE